MNTMNVSDEWRRAGMNGTHEDRRVFLDQCYHGARGVMAALLMNAASVAPGLGPRAAFAFLRDRMVKANAQQAAMSELDPWQAEAYVEAHRRAYDDVGREHGLIDPPGG